MALRKKSIVVLICDIEIMKNVKSDIDSLCVVVFIIFVIYLILTSCFLFGLATCLLRTTMSFLRKLRNKLLGLNHVVFSEKIDNRRNFGFEACYFFFMKLVVNGNMFQ